jgi:hypothetical protein
MCPVSQIRTTIGYNGYSVVITVVFMSVLRKLSATNLVYRQFQCMLLCFNDSCFSDLSHNEITYLVDGTFIGMPRLLSL